MRGRIRSYDRRMKLSIALLLALTLLGCASNQEMRDIDRFVNTTLQTLPEIPSIGLAIVHDGKRIARAYGYADLARRIPADAETGYYNGSNTKAYTAAMVVMLAQEGLIDLDAPVSKYIPELHLDITLRKFLSHTSGIDNFPVVFRTAFSGEHTPAGGFPIRQPRIRDGQPGHRARTGRKWQDVLDQKLFEPLGMHRTPAPPSPRRIASRHPPSATASSSTAPATASAGTSRRCTARR